MLGTLPADDGADVLDVEEDAFGGLAIKGVSPRDISTALAPEGEAWTAPTLADLTDKPWGDLSDAEKRKIAGHFAWAAAIPPDKSDDLKLPHHNLAARVVLRGIAAAAGRLNQSQIPAADMEAVKAHLKRHYAAFGKPIPDALKDIGGNEQVLTLDDDDGGEDIGLDPRDVVAGIRAALHDAIGDVAAQEVKRTFHRLRGRAL